MTREIKFRGKRLDNGEWIFGSLFNFAGECEIADCNTIDYSRYDVDPSTVGQYTGLEDKNGTEIWEGDILKDDMGYLAVVGYSMGSFFVDFGDGTDLQYFFDCVHEVCGVVGNIHDNPELLKGGEQ